MKDDENVKEILKDLFYNKLNLSLENNIKEIVNNTIAPYNTWEEYLKHGDMFLNIKLKKN